MTWNNTLTSINDKVIEKAVEFGMSKQQVEKFKEYDIKEMYEVNGAICFACKKGLPCSKHPSGSTALLRRKFQETRFKSKSKPNSRVHSSQSS